MKISVRRMWKMRLWWSYTKPYMYNRFREWNNDNFVSNRVLCTETDHRSTKVTHLIIAIVAIQATVIFETIDMDFYRLGT